MRVGVQTVKVVMQSDRLDAKEQWPSRNYYRPWSAYGGTISLLSLLISLHNNVSIKGKITCSKLSIAYQY